MQFFGDELVLPRKKWRLHPFTRLCASKPRAAPRSVVLTDWPSIINTDGQAALPHNRGPGRGALDLDKPTRQCTVSHIIMASLHAKWATRRGNVSAYRRLENKTDFRHG
jgi:hypothetical protein